MRTAAQRTISLSQAPHHGLSWPRVLILPGGPAGPAPPPLQEARGGRGSRSSQQDTGYAAAKIQNGAVCCGTRPWLTHSERSITLTEYYALSYTGQPARTPIDGVHTSHTTPATEDQTVTVAAGWGACVWPRAAPAGFVRRAEGSRLSLIDRTWTECRAAGVDVRTRGLPDFRRKPGTRHGERRFRRHVGSRQHRGGLGRTRPLWRLAMGRRGRAGAGVRGVGLLGGARPRVPLWKAMAAVPVYGLPVLVRGR